MCASSLVEHLSLSTLEAGARKALTFVLYLSLSLIATISSGSSFQRWEAVGKNVHVHIDVIK